MLIPSTDREPEAWIGRETGSPGASRTLASVVPAIFPAYVLIAHAIHLAPGLRSLSAIRFDGPSNAHPKIEKLFGELGARLPPGVRASRARNAGTVTSRAGQVRVRWQSLAAHFGRELGGPVSFGTLWDLIPGDWPDDLDGPAEGSLTVDECRALIDLLQPVTNEPVTFFYRWANTEGWTGRCDTGSLTDLLEYFDLEDVSGTPAYWWPEDRSWVVCTDIDSCYTLVGGSEQLISSILRHPEFESHRVNPEDPFP